MHEFATQLTALGDQAAAKRKSMRPVNNFSMITFALIACAAHAYQRPLTLDRPRLGRCEPNQTTSSPTPPTSRTDHQSQALANPRDALAVTLLLVGGRISLANVVGAYDATYVDAERWAVALGAASAAAAVAQLARPQHLAEPAARHH